MADACVCHQTPRDVHNMCGVGGYLVSDDLIPLKRPHFELRDHQLFFLLSSRAHARLDANDEALWGAIDGTATVGRLRTSIPDVEARLHRLWDEGVCELAPSRFPPNRRRILVVEPHMDGAVLSVGGSMWSRREECEFTLVTVAGRSNFTSYYDIDREFFDVARVTELRKAESALVMRLLGGRHSTLDELEAPLRLQPGNWTLDWYRHHRKLVDAFIMHAATPQDVEAWSGAVERLLGASDTDEIWLPLGVGAHTDHELTRDACLRALHRLGDRVSRLPLFFYQDVPYASQFPTHTDRILEALSAAGGVLDRQPEDIAQSLEHKLRLASIFASQFKPEYITPRIEESARRASPHGEGLAELRFRAKRLPGVVEPLAVYSGRSAVESLVPRLGAWYKQHRSAKRIRILTPVPVARWEDDCSLLLDAFPHADFEVHVSSEYADETARLESRRLQVRIVHGRRVAWLLRLLGQALSRPCPTIILTGEGLQAFSSLARAAFLASDPIVATRMNDVALALRAVRDRSG